jgi:hypothetical protein
VSNHSMRPISLAAVAALAWMGVLHGAGPAYADCNWHLPSSITLIQDNNLQVIFASSNDVVMGQAKYAHVGGDDWTYGNGKGSVGNNRHSVNFTGDWTSGPGAGLYNNYHGEIAADGSMSGTTTNSKGTQNSWTSQTNASCEERKPIGTPVEVPDDPSPTQQMPSPTQQMPSPTQQMPSPTQQQPRRDSQIPSVLDEVTFEVTGSGTVYSIVTDPSTSPVGENSPAPFKRTVSVNPDTKLFQVVATTKTGQQGCRLTVNGTVVAEQPVGSNPHCVYNR